jgi:ubiquinone/menaquinone biosynthesis C-methylase UbiE
MKYRESGMPDEEMWNSFFDPEVILDLLDVTVGINGFLDIGCGYGTFLLAASKRVNKAVGIDIDEQMIDYCRSKIDANQNHNIELIHGDISQEQSLSLLRSYSTNIDYVTLFNILHCENPDKLLQSVYGILEDNGRIGVIHWNYENTPRGPSMEIRPRPEQIIALAENTGLTLIKQVDLPPHHYGLVFIKY